MKGNHTIIFYVTFNFSFDLTCQRLNVFHFVCCFSYAHTLIIQLIILLSILMTFASNISHTHFILLIFYLFQPKPMFYLHSKQNTVYSSIFKSFMFVPSIDQVLPESQIIKLLKFNMWS